MESNFHIAAFYKFSPIPAERLTELQHSLKTFGAENNMRGLVLIAQEGINGTVCAEPSVIIQWKKMLTDAFGEMIFNDSEAKTHVFPRWLVKIKKEIVTLKQDDVQPQGLHKHLTPEEWDSMIEREDVVIIDARNTYETKIGMFEGAIDPRTRSFHEFADFAASTDIPKDKKVMMYCTGGIRCEKALIEMEKRGFKNVFQLKGGILSYLKKFPNKKFKGECFVFDHRVAVNQELKPSMQYGLCPHCGDPADQIVDCMHCNKNSLVCASCTQIEGGITCSKRCKNEFMQKLTYSK